MRRFTHPSCRLDVDVEEAIQLVRRFLHEETSPSDWVIINEVRTPRVTRLILQDRASSFHLVRPSRAQWRFQSLDDGSKVEFQYILTARQLLVLHLLLITCFLIVGMVLRLSPLSALGLVLGLSATILGGSLLLAWAMTTTVADHARSFCKYAHDETGVAIPFVQGFFGGKAGGLTLMCYALLLVAGFVSIFLRDYQALVLFESVGFVSLLVLLVPYALLVTTSERLDDRLSHSMPYLMGVITLITYASWPQLMRTAATTTRAALLVLVILCASFFLWCTIRVCKRLAAVPEPHELSLTLTPDPTWVQTSATGMNLLIWAVAIYTQYQASAWFIRTSKDTLDFCWAVPLALGYATLIAVAVRRTMQLGRELRNAPTDLMVKCRELALGLRTTPPRLAIGTTNHAEYHLLFGPVISIVDNDTKLPKAEIEALLLHELWHIQEHARLLCILDLLGTITFCGRGLLGIIINPRDYEFAADQAAAAELNRLHHDHNGYEIVASMISTASRQDTTGKKKKPSSIGLLAHLFFGNGAQWYQHPTVEERRRALKEESRCPA